MSKTAEQLEGFESRVKHVYLDSRGYQTIGVGFLVDERRGGGLRDEEIDFILANRIEILSEAIVKAFPWADSLSEPRFAVLLNMAYQLGLEGLAGFKMALQAIRDERWAEAANQMQHSDWYQQTRERCKTLARQMETGEWQT